MAACVLDCSVALSWILPGEQDPAVSAVLDLVADDGAMVPELWSLETANVLLMAERRGRLTLAQRVAALTALRALHITTDRETSTVAWGSIIDLAAARNLTVYDAAYLELALRVGLPLASRDNALLQAARAAGVRTLGHS
jgi:predicted nucleic acid-binding protein